MTTQPKSISLKEFEELAKVFEASHGWHLDESYSVAIESFKAFIFKEELEKDHRRKDYEKLKEEYLKLKDEFDPEYRPNNEEPSVCVFQAADGSLYIPSTGGADCGLCAFKDKWEDCKSSWKVHDCVNKEVYWIKAK